MGQGKGERGSYPTFVHPATNIYELSLSLWVSQDSNLKNDKVRHDVILQTNPIWDCLEVRKFEIVLFIFYQFFSIGFPVERSWTIWTDCLTTRTNLLIESIVCFCSRDSLGRNNDTYSPC